MQQFDIYYFVLSPSYWKTVKLAQVNEEKAVNLTKEIQGLEEENQQLRSVYILDICGFFCLGLIFWYLRLFLPVKQKWSYCI